MKNELKANDQKKKFDTKVDRKTVAALKADKQRKVITNQTIYKNGKDNH